MRHARATAKAIRPLAITVVEAAFGALLVPVPGRAETADAPRPATPEITVRLAAITGAAEKEHLLAEPTDAQPQDLHGPLGPEISG